MIDTIALALGHALLVYALLRLTLRADVDEDPLLARLQQEAEVRRRATSAAGRKQQRNAGRGLHTAPPAGEGAPR